MTHAPGGSPTPRVDGDKRQACELIGLPVMLFDDKEKNVKQTEKSGGCGCIVRRGRKSKHGVLDGFFVSNDPKEWPELVVGWDRAVREATVQTTCD